MPGYNHYSWCMCGWCFKTGSNGYSARRTTNNFDRAYFDTSYATRILKEHGADRSWTACFVIPNASCPVCGAKVYYYQNQFGSRVFFDELGWPWPKHPCTDNSRQPTGGPIVSAAPFTLRKRGVVAEIMEAARTANFDPSATFRGKYGHSPYDLLVVLEVKRVGFENFIKAESISPPLDEPVFLAFSSAKTIPLVGDHFSFNGKEASFINPDTLQPQGYKAKAIAQEAFAAAGKDRA